MAKMSVSVRKGKGSLGHNNRVFLTPNVDPERVKLDIVYKQEPIKDVYDKLFGAEVERYNAGKKPSRQIADYMEKIRTSGNGEKVFYETVVQVGNRYTCGNFTKDADRAKIILDEYMKSFEERNPNLYVFNAVMHLDEPQGTPHLHIDWIPVAHGYQQGLQVRNSLDKALKEQGIDGGSNKKENSTLAWQEREKQAVEHIMERYGWQRAEESGLRRKNLTVDQYKAVAQEIENQVAVLPEQITATKVPFSDNKVVVSKAELDALTLRAKLSTIHEEATIAFEEKVQENMEAHQSFVEEHRENMKNRELALLAKEGDFYVAEKEYKRSLIDLNIEKSRYSRLYEEQRGINEAYEQVVAENGLLKTQNSALKAENATIRAETEKMVEEAVRPLKAQIEALRGRLQQTVESVTRPLREQIEALKTKLHDVASGERTLLRAVRFVAEEVAGKVGRELLGAISKTGNEWLKEDGFEEFIDEDYYVPGSIAKNVKMELTFKDGEKGKGVYTSNDILLENFDNVSQARNYFPECSIEDLTKSRSKSNDGWSR